MTAFISALLVMVASLVAAPAVLANHDSGQGKSQDHLHGKKADHLHGKKARLDGASSPPLVGSPVLGSPLLLDGGASPVPGGGVSPLLSDGASPLLAGGASSPLQVVAIPQPPSFWLLALGVIAAGVATGYRRLSSD